MDIKKIKRGHFYLHLSSGRKSQFYFLHFVEAESQFICSQLRKKQGNSLCAASSCFNFEEEELYFSLIFQKTIKEPS